MKIAERFNSDTPKFWRKIGRLGYVLAALAVTLTVPPAAALIPSVVPAILGTAGGVLKIVSTLGVNEEPDNKELKP